MASCVTECKTAATSRTVHQLLPSSHGQQWFSWLGCSTATRRTLLIPGQFGYVLAPQKHRPDTLPPCIRPLLCTYPARRAIWRFPLISISSTLLSTSKATGPTFPGQGHCSLSTLHQRLLIEQCCQTVRTLLVTLLHLPDRACCNVVRAEVSNTNGNILGEKHFGRWSYFHQFHK